jgi:hypothetical protein
MSKSGQLAIDDRTKVRSSMVKFSSKTSFISMAWPWMTELCAFGHPWKPSASLFEMDASRKTHPA